MTEQINIATLPENPNALPSPTYNPDKSDVLKIVDYSDKSFVVFGDATQTYKQQMSDLGGKYNGRLKDRPGFEGGPGWIFMTKYKPKVYDFVNKVNTREINQHEGVPQQGDQITLPTVVGPVKNSTYQTVHWKVFKPTEGMTVTIKAGGASSVGEVIQTESHRNVVDTCYINLNGNTSKLVICNGYWSVWGYMVDHTVTFSVTEKTSPEKYDYQDIAGI